MKFSENWLRQHVKTTASREQLCATLTAIGLEVEALTPLGAQLDGVVVARIVSAAPHPEADRLQVCGVDAGGGDTLQIVCGAPNARVGLIAPLATIGSVVGTMTITAATLRGVASNGMLCSAKELALDDDASGLLELPDDAPVGTPLADYLGLPDASIELKLTPNRADCFGIRGIAFDVAAALGSTVERYVAPAITPTSDATLAVELHAGSDAPRYVGRVLEGVDVSARTPLWMAERLRRSGVRPVSLLVDVTQYVMLETGQPMHAFDRDLMTGPVGVRHARVGERLTLLDGREVELNETFLVVTDGSGSDGSDTDRSRAVALAGIMGGLDTRVTDGTRNVFLEAAHFAPAAIIGRGRSFGLHTDAGHRFERGVDPELPRTAIEVATRLILDIAGGAAGPVIEVDRPDDLTKPAPITLRRARLARVLGLVVADADVDRILRALGLAVEATDDGWQVTAPTRRFDLAIEEDLIEEVARIHGYDVIPTTLPGGATRIAAVSELRVDAAELRRQLVARDYLEAINYAFVDARLLGRWDASDDGGVVLANPLSAELGVMRTSLLPGLVEALSRNVARQQPRVRLFETGKVFARAPTPGSDAALAVAAIASDAADAATSPAPLETVRIAAVAMGDAADGAWDQAPRALDVHDIRGDLDSLAKASGAVLDYRPSSRACGHPGRSADICRDGIRVGWMGELHPRLLRALDLDATVIAFEVDLSALQRRALPRAAVPSRFPSVRRDLAFVVPDTVSWADVAGTVRSAAGSALVDLHLFDRYVGKGVESGFKSLAMGLILQEDSRTLTDRNVDAVQAAVAAALASAHGARIRG